MSIQEEFEKAWKAQIIQATDRDRMVAWGASLWAAKWMAERCGNLANKIMSEKSDPREACVAQEIKLEIRQLSKELE